MTFGIVLIFGLLLVKHGVLITYDFIENSGGISYDLSIR